MAGQIWNEKIKKKIFRCLIPISYDLKLIREYFWYNSKRNRKSMCKMRAYGRLVGHGYESSPNTLYHIENWKAYRSFHTISLYVLKCTHNRHTLCVVRIQKRKHSQQLGVDSSERSFCALSLSLSLGCAECVTHTQCLRSTKMHDTRYSVRQTGKCTHVPTINTIRAIRICWRIYTQTITRTHILFGCYILSLPLCVCHSSVFWYTGQAI